MAREKRLNKTLRGAMAHQNEELNMLNLQVEDEDAAFLMGLLQGVRNQKQKQLDEGGHPSVHYPEALRTSIDHIDRLIDELNEQFYRRAKEQGED